MSYIQNHGILQQTVKKSVTIDAANQSILYSSGQPFGGLLDGQTPFSFSVWWKPDDVTEQGNFFSSHLAFSPFRGISLSNRGGALDGFRFYIIDDAFPGDTLRVDFVTGGLTNDTWYHIVVTYAGGQEPADCDCYIDAVSLAQDPAEELDNLGGGIVTTDDLELFNGNLLGGALTGKFDEVTWWDKALSSSEVSQLYNSGVPNNPRTLAFSGNLVHWLRFDEDAVFYPDAYDSQGTTTPEYVNIPVTNITEDVPE